MSASGDTHGVALDSPPTGAVALIGTLDTKGAEYAFVRDRIAAAGIPTILLDCGTLGAPTVAPDIDRARVAASAGSDVDTLTRTGDRNTAMETMARGAATIARELHDAGHLAGALVLGGSNAGFLMSRVAAALPIGCPKILVSTIVAGDTRPYVGTSDLTMLYPVVDIAGLNSVSVPVLARAADMMVGALRGPDLPTDLTVRGTVGCSMFGVTTACVSAVQRHVEELGLEPLVFHATGVGGRALETLIASGAVDAVADVTTTELADDLLGGVCTAGPDRLTSAARAGVPQVVSVGALDMCNFGPMDSVPAEFADRQLFAHNPSVTLMRTNPAENAELGRCIAAKLAEATAFVEVHVPARGFSQISAPGGPFHDPEADRALIDALRAHLRADIPLHVHDLAVNDPEFAAQIASALDRALATVEGGTRP